MCGLVGTAYAQSSALAPRQDPPTSLNGQWAFRTDPANVGETAGWFQPSTNVTSWDSLSVPGNWDLRNEYANYVGKGWYRKTLVVPQTTKGKTVRLTFEGVYHDSRVWLNGQLLGSNNSGYLPFEFDVTTQLNYGGPNTIVVCADNTFRRGAIWNWGGIRRPVALEVTDPIRIVQQHITPAVDLAKRIAAVSIRVFLQNHEATARTVQGEVQLSAPNGYRKTIPFTATVPPNERGEAVVNANLTKEQLHLWHFDDPFLYTSAVKLTATGQIVSNRFGLRKIEVDNQNYAFKLNGEAIRPMGLNLVPDDRTTGNTLPLWRIKEDVDKLKELGANMARLSHLPLPADMLDYLDERGMLVISEIPLWGFDQLADKDSPVVKTWLNRLIMSQYNHPCIVAWSVGNEIGDYPKALDYVKSATQHVRQLDPSRLATMVSHTAARNEPGRRADDPLQFSDLGLINSYGKGIGQTADRIHKYYPGKVLFYTEYGYTQLQENLDTDVDAKAMVDSIRGRPYLIGGSLWTFNDYRSSYVGTKEYSQNRPWGVLDVFRQKKRAWYSFRREMAPMRKMAVKGVSTTGVTVVLTPRSVFDLPAYTLTGYRLVWKMLDPNGKFVQGGFATLPVIRPGNAALQQSIQWTGVDKANPAGSVQVALVSPLNYAVYDTTLCFSKPQPPTVLSAMGGRTEQNDTRPNSGMIRVTFSPSPTATGYKVRYGVGGLTNETPVMLNLFTDIPKLAFDTTYQVAVVAVNSAGESELANVQSVRVDRDAYRAPVVQYVEPADGGFFVGYATQVDDYLFQVQYTQKSGDYAQSAIHQASTKGVMAVSGLTNGKQYYFHLRRVKDNNYASAWSEEHSVVPDGGQRPPAPVLQGIIRQNDEAELFFIPVLKAIGYVLEYRPAAATNWTQIQISATQPGLFHLTGLDKTKPYQFRLATRNAVGQSEYSPLIDSLSNAQARRN